MRQKDANMVAKIIGNEMRLAPANEQAGLEVAAGAVRAQMEGTDRNFNKSEFDRNLAEGKSKGWSA